MEVLNSRNHLKQLKTISTIPQSCPKLTFKPLKTGKICPIPLNHQNINETNKLNSILNLRAYKHLKRISAVGPKTIESLLCLRKARNVKTMRKFEFDPYLCDDSCLRELNMAYDKVKKAHDLNIIIRRMDKKDVENKKPFLLRKVRRLTKFRMEFVYNGEDIKTSPYFFLQEVSKCYSLTSLTLFALNLPYVCDQALKVFINFRRNLLRLQELKMTKYKNYQVLNIADQANFELPINRLFNIKRLDFSIGSKPGWISISEDTETGFYFLDYIRCAPQVEEITLKFLKFPTILDFIVGFIEVLPTLTKLKRLYLDFMNSQIGDIELGELSTNLRKLPVLKNFTLRIYQYPNVSGDVICHLIDSLTRHKSIETFDFYTKRLDMPSSQVDDLVETLSGMPNVTASRYKQTLRAYREKQTS